jgi:hypothetical protein
MAAPVDLGWATVTVWLVVNLVNVLQSIGFALRPSRGMGPNRRIGLLIAALAVPAGAALIGLVRQGSAQWVGPAVFIGFVLLMLVVDYWRPIEFRSPTRQSVLVPYLVLFFGGIVAMGAPMFWIDRGLWAVTVATSLLLLTSMVFAHRSAGHN